MQNCAAGNVRLDIYVLVSKTSRKISFESATIGPTGDTTLLFCVVLS